MKVFLLSSLLKVQTFIKILFRLRLQVSNNFGSGTLILILLNNRYRYHLEDSQELRLDGHQVQLDVQGRLILPRQARLHDN